MRPRRTVLAPSSRGRSVASMMLGSLPSEVEEFFDLALDMMLIVGFDGYQKRVNPACQRALGYPLEDLRSRHFADFVHPEDLPAVLDRFRELVEGDSDGVTGFESRSIHADGSVRRFEWNARTIPERRLVFAVGRDVTDQ